jgi:NAD+ diphosphatase
MMNQGRQFELGSVPPVYSTGPSRWFVFGGSRLLVRLGPSEAALPGWSDFSDSGLTALSRHYVGALDGQPCYALEVPEGTSPPEGMVFEGLRPLYGRLEEDLFWVAGRALQIVDWDRTHQFCGRCGSEIAVRTIERCKECPQCGLLHFPRLAPAVIVAVERGDELLMARSRHFAPGVYSVVAGFVEPGETLEGAVAREVLEETGIRVKDIRYFGSQPWPFPHSLMIGFTAAYEGGELRIDPTELEDAGWYRADRFPGLPGRLSIAWRLIQSFLATHGGDARA